MYFFCSLLLTCISIVFYWTYKTSVYSPDFPKNNFHDDGLEIDTCWRLISAHKDTKFDNVYCD